MSTQLSVCKFISGVLCNRTRRRVLPVGGAWSPRIKVTPRLFVVSPDAKLLYFGGSWDNSVRVYGIKTGKQIAYAVRHIGRCLLQPLAENGTNLSTPNG